MITVQRLEEGILATPGFRATGVSCGLKNGGSKDISLLLSQYPCITAMAFSKNRIQGAHVTVDKNRMNNECYALLINSGNANCLTGQAGLDHAEQMVSLTEDLLNIPKDSCLLASTGVIGQQINMIRVKYGIERLTNIIHNESNIRNFCAGISTSNTRQKNLAYQFKIDQEDIYIGISAKGDSMIKPWLETMHGTLITVITTNINISKPLLQKALSIGIETSFNRISIDNDRSPNDTVILLSNQKSNISQITDENDPRFTVFTNSLQTALLETAKLLLKQGLGTTKLVHLKIKNATSKEQADLTARSIAESYQVKTMLFGQKIAWSKIINVIASQPQIDFDLNKLTLSINAYTVFENGELNHTNIAQSLQDIYSLECCIAINLNIGTEDSELWTCDMTHDYIKFNSILSENN